MARGNIKFKFYQKDYDQLCYDCRGFLFTADKDSNKFGLGKDGYLYVESNGVGKVINNTILVNQFIGRDINPAWTGDNRTDYIFEIKIPDGEFEAIKNSPCLSGFQYELL